MFMSKLVSSLLALWTCFKHTPCSYVMPAYRGWRQTAAHVVGVSHNKPNHGGEGGRAAALTCNRIDLQIVQVVAKI